MALIDQILKAYRGKPEAVLGTVVDLEGSGYRRPGARILIFDDGRHVGAISGGCLEKDAARNARAWAEDGPTTVLFDTRSNRFEPLGKYGTGCEGVVHLFLQALPLADEQIDPLVALGKLRAAGREAVVVTAYASSDPRATLGCAAIVERQGVRWSPQFPDELRAMVVEGAKRALGEQRTIGLKLPAAGCEWRLLVEYAAPAPELVVVGTGQDAEALVNVARPLGWRIRVVGTDPLKLDARRFPDAETTCLTSAAHAQEVEVGPHSFVVQMTHHFEQDARMLPHWLASPAPYVGLLGPTSRTRRLIMQLHEDGALPDADQLDKLATPVGLDLGGDDPYEVAVSIISQVVARKNGRTGGPLSERGAAIHDPHSIESLATEEEKL